LLIHRVLTYIPISSPKLAVEYVEVPLDRGRAASDDLALMFEWFDRVGHSADIAALRRDYPKVGWQTFEA
jgi:hypothetical protein